MSSNLDIANWSAAKIMAACSPTYGRYRRRRTSAYTTYFAQHPELRSLTHPYSARDLGSALPSGLDGLAELLPASERHRYHLSGNSSQVLALGLLGAAGTSDRSLGWLARAFPTLPAPDTGNVTIGFEHTVGPEVLDERPRQTSVDFMVRTDAMLLCVECKWTEAGLGSCGCGIQAAAESACRPRIRERHRYWSAAQDDLGLADVGHGQPCLLSFTYQAVRNVAAARALAAPGQQPVFGLIYDAENPYFAGCGDWPGWPSVLQAAMQRTEAHVSFVSISWQHLALLLPPDEAVAQWALEKHGIAGHGMAAAA